MPPIIECGFQDADGHGVPDRLVTYGPTCQVTVSFLDMDDDGIAKAAGDTKDCYALVDTGAITSCIDEQIAQELGLPVVDIQQMAGVGGVKDHNVYLAIVVIPDLKFDHYGRFAGVDMTVQEHKVLLGRTFLNGVIMIYDGIRGTATIACNG